MAKRLRGENSLIQKSINLSEAEWSVIEEQAKKFGVSNSTIISGIIIDQMFLNTLKNSDEKISELYLNYIKLFRDYYNQVQKGVLKAAEEQLQDWFKEQTTNDSPF